MKEIKFIVYPVPKNMNKQWQENLLRRLIVKPLSISAQAVEVVLMEISTSGTMLKLCPYSATSLGAGMGNPWWVKTEDYEILEVLPDLDPAASRAEVMTLVDEMRTSDDPVSVTLMNDNAEADRACEQCAVDVCALWTGYVEKRYLGNTVLIAVRAAHMDWKAKITQALTEAGAPPSIIRAAQRKR